MSRITWDAVGEKLYETGVKQGVLYPAGTGQAAGTYPSGVAWNGLTGVTEKPSGADATKIYADDAKYLTLIAAEDYGLTIEAYTYPDEFMECDGSYALTTGVTIGQQTRKGFGFCYRTIVGNDTTGESYGYKLHLNYGCLASPSERAYSTVNDSPEAITFSWEVNTTPVNVTGHKPTALITVDSTKLVDASKILVLEAVLYGVDATTFSAESTYAVGAAVTKTEGTTTKYYICKTAVTVAGEWDASKWVEVPGVGPRLPLPDEVLTLMS